MQIDGKQLGTLASVELAEAFTDFVLSRQAMQCTKTTMEYYRYTACKFLTWVEGKGEVEIRELKRVPPERGDFITIDT